MAIKEHFEGKRDLGLIDPRKLNIDPDYNVRDLEKSEAREGLDYLKSLIRSTGVQTALRIREDNEGRLIVVRGHRRLKVVMELIEEGHPIKLVPVTQEPRGTTPAERNWDLIDSNSEEPLKGIERAEALYRQIHVFGWSEEEVLRRTGKTRQWLNQQLDLRALPEPVKEHVRKGDISPTLARNIAKGVDPEFAADLIRKNKEENKRLGVGKQGGKVTPKTLARGKKKPEPETVSEAKAPQPTSEPPREELPAERGTVANQAQDVADQPEPQAEGQEPAATETRAPIGYARTAPFIPLSDLEPPPPATEPEQPSEHPKPNGELRDASAFLIGAIEEWGVETFSDDTKVPMEFLAGDLKRFHAAYLQERAGS